MKVGRKIGLTFALVMIACLVMMFVPTGSASAAGEELTTPSGIPSEGPSSDVDGVSTIDDEIHMFKKNMDVWFMLMMVAFLMMFIRKFEWGVALATLLVTAGSFLTYMGIYEFYFGEAWNMELMLGGVICAITVVIGIGVFLGTIKMWQYFLAGVLFAPVYVGLEHFLFNIMDATDPGGSMLVHMCAAYFGLGVALIVREKRAFDEPMYTSTHSVTFVWLGTMLLWILWPSFVTALLPADQVAWGMITCYMAGLGSILTTYLVCQIVQKKVNPLVYTYAMLAGPVAIGSPLLSVDQWGGLAIGLFAGVVSALSFIYLQPWLCSKLGVLDVMGVHNLHGMGGWVGALSIVVITGSFTNAFSAVGTAVLTLIGGIIAGVIIRLTRGRIADEDLFTDDADFIKSEAPKEQAL